MSPDDAQVRLDICAGCLTRCPAPAPRDPCWVCPAGIYQAHGSCGASLPLGDQLAAAIERTVLEPARRHAPAIVAAVEFCGGCHHARQALGSTQPHRDPGIVL